MSHRTGKYINQFLRTTVAVFLVSLAFIPSLHATNIKPETLNLKPQTGSLIAYEDTLKTLGDSVLHGSSDAVRELANKNFKTILEKVLNERESFEFTFDSVKTLGKETAPDKTFRIYNWLLPKYDGSNYSYFGFVQTFDKKKNEIKVFALTDSSKVLINPQSLKLRSDNWYGALYYKILKRKKGGKYYYTLLGWHGKNQSTTQKIIDVIYFASGKPMFGYPLFKTEKVYKDRIIFEYTAQVVMSLKYEDAKGMIVFDHLSPSSKEMENNFSVYGPDGSYDAFRFKGGHWLYVKDVDVQMNWKPKKQPKEPQVHDMPIEERK